jgi:hypothetical protein
MPVSKAIMMVKLFILAILNMTSEEQQRLARIAHYRVMAAMPNLVIPTPSVRVNRKTRRQARNADNAASVVAARGFDRGAANAWKARNNRHLPRVAVRV